MKFYRVENKFNESPYTTKKAELTLMEYLSMEDILDNENYDNRWEDYMKTHPSPRGKYVQLYNQLFESEIIHCEDYVYGFNSIKQLKKWFYLEKEIEYLKLFKFCISVYETDCILSSNFQAVAKLNTLKLIEKIDI